MEQYFVGNCLDCHKTSRLELYDFGNNAMPSCPHCGSKLRIEYFDMKHNAIIVLPKNYSQEDFFMINEVFSLGIFDNYTKRIVKNIQSLREKALIIDMGLDDKVIEILKLLMFVQLGDTKPEFKVKNCLFEIRNEEKAICFYNAQGDCIVTQYNNEGYINAETSLYKIIDKNSKSVFEIIDFNWAHKMLTPLYEKRTSNISKSTAAKNTTKSQIRFCKMCGKQIDQYTKKCSGCGKQYFKGINFFGFLRKN